MPNIFDYLDWRGDLPFSVVPFCEVDNLILAEIAYIDFYGVLSEHFSEPMKLRDAAEKLSFYREEDSVETGVLLPKDILPLFYKAAESKRFGEMLVCGFETRTDTGSEVQFAAVTMLLGDGTAFVSYRGTDDTLVGWKEDFNMTFLPVIPSQSYAVQYLDRMAAIYPERLRVGGHSKGGNLAVYAAACASPDTQKRVIEVYNNDGPGFSREFLDSEGYARIRERVRTIVPQTSVVGMLLEHECDYTVVKSTQSGLFQHDGFSWEVLGARFVRVEDRTAGSKIVDRTLKSWVAELDDEAREDFVEALYAILSSTGVETLTGIRTGKDSFSKILRSITREQRAVLQKTLRELIYSAQRVLREDRDEKREEKRIRKEYEDAEKLLRKQERSKEEEKKKKRREALMVAVRPIRFRIVRAEAPIKQSVKQSPDAR